MVGLPLKRREFLAAVSWAAISPAAAAASPVPATARATPVPPGSVVLKPSIFADHVAVTRRYLAALDPARLLHNFHRSAGLEPLGEMYRGWESQGIAGHTLGHWLSASSRVIADHGDRDLSAKVDFVVQELARIQRAHGDGYIGGTTVVRDGQTVDGKIVFEEVRRGDIRSQGWDLNGGWVPLYAWHKVQAGLIDAVRLAGKADALPVLKGMARYLATIVDTLTDAQLQRVLHAEHGGIVEAFADTFVLTGDSRWLQVAERLRHSAVVNPLFEGRDVLSGLHANTQIPKVIGLARLHELTGSKAYADASRFFFRTVVEDHSYVIGGNSEREHFGPPRRLATRLTEATCEACNSYNMLKLTRHLYGWDPKASYFDYYERVQLNHILAHQRPDTGAFVYFMPMAAGAKRTYSSPDADFWCCVGSGMESHSKHTDSIFWENSATLFVNLFIPSVLSLKDRSLVLEMDTRFPMEGTVTMTVKSAPADSLEIALRIPDWAEGAQVFVGDRIVRPVLRDGYAVLRRQWKAGDSIRLNLPMGLRSEATPDDASMVAFLSGPLVLSVDAGAAHDPFDGSPPAIVTQGGVVDALIPLTGQQHQYRAHHALGGEVRLRPFFDMYDRRSSVYLKSFTPQSWAEEGPAFLATEAERLRLAQQTIDVFHIGEQQPEQDHRFSATRSEVTHFYGKTARRIPQGESMQFEVARRAGNSVLQITYVWFETDRTIDIEVDGHLIATERRLPSSAQDWIVVSYPLPPTSAASSIVRLSARKGDATVYGVRVMAVDEVDRSI